MSIQDMINDIMADNNTGANATFNALLGDKIADTIEQEKIAVANTIFNSTEELSDDDVEPDEEDWDDEDIESIDTTAEEDIEDVDIEDVDFDDEPVEEED